MSTRSRTFIDAIRVLRYGALSDELTKELQRVVLACADTGRKGTLTLRLSIKPGKAGQLEIADAVSVKLPEPDRAVSLLFATPDGNLQREDPRQLSLEGVRVVSRDGDELIVHRCDLDAGKSYKTTTFNFAVHRQPDQYRMIVERKGAIDPA